MRTIPKAPTSYPLGILIRTGKHQTKLSITNITPATGVLQLIRVRRGIQVQCIDETPTVWMANKVYEVKSVVPGHEPAISEDVRARITPMAIPDQLNVMLIMVDDKQCYPMAVQVPNTSSWAELFQAWHSVATGTFSEEIRNRFPRDPNAYELKDEHGEDILNMDKKPKIFAILKKAVPAPTAPTEGHSFAAHATAQGPVKVTVSYLNLPAHLKYQKYACKMMVFPDEPESEILIRWVIDKRALDAVKEERRQMAEHMSLNADEYELVMNNGRPAQRPWK
jgi:hypothetical protein